MTTNWRLSASAHRNGSCSGRPAETTHSVSCPGHFAPHIGAERAFAGHDGTGVLPLLIA